MTLFADHVAKALGVKVPEDYAGFMESHGKRLPEDPVHDESWIGGLGSRDFVVGATLAFRSMLPHFGHKIVVIGYSGLKTIIVNRMHEEIDEYVMLDTVDGSVLAVDSRGVANRIAASFDAWVGPELLRAGLRDKYKSSFSAVVFDDEHRAEEARLKLLDLQHEGFVDLEDAVVVVKDRNGAVRFHRMHKPARKGAFAGSITGLIVGSILLSPLVGAALGAVAGAFSASLSEVGIEERFIKELSGKFKPGCSALFTLVRKADPERMKNAFLGFGGKVLVHSVSKEREAAIQALLDAAGERPE